MATDEADKAFITNQLSESDCSSWRFGSWSKLQSMTNLLVPYLSACSMLTDVLTEHDHLSVTRILTSYNHTMKP